MQEGLDRFKKSVYLLENIRIIRKDENDVNTMVLVHSFQSRLVEYLENNNKLPGE